MDQSVTPNTPPDFDVRDFATIGTPPNDPEVGADQEDAPRGGVTPYSSDQIAGAVALVSSFGLPAKVIGQYQAELIEASSSTLETMGMGEALAHYGIGEGSGVDNLPPWARLLVGGIATGYTVLTMRAAYQHPIEAPKPNSPLMRGWRWLRSRMKRGENEPVANANRGAASPDEGAHV